MRGLNSETYYFTILVVKYLETRQIEGRKDAWLHGEGKEFLKPAFSFLFFLI